jgi:hypothetical protein
LWVTEPTVGLLGEAIGEAATAVQREQTGSVSPTLIADLRHRPIGGKRNSSKLTLTLDITWTIAINRRGRDACLVEVVVSWG